MHNCDLHVHMVGHEKRNTLAQTVADCHALDEGLSQAELGSCSLCPACCEGLGALWIRHAALCLPSSHSNRL